MDPHYIIHNLYFMYMTWSTKNKPFRDCSLWYRGCYAIGWAIGGCPGKGILDNPHIYIYPYCTHDMLYIYIYTQYYIIITHIYIYICILFNQLSLIHIDPSFFWLGIPVWTNWTQIVRKDDLHVLEDTFDDQQPGNPRRLSGWLCRLCPFWASLYRSYLLLNWE